MNGHNSGSQLEVFIRRLVTNFLYFGETRTKNDIIYWQSGGKRWKIMSEGKKVV